MKLTLVGAGIYPQRDLTLGGLEALKKSSCVLFHSFEGADAFFKEHNINNSVNLSLLYKDQAIDSDNYNSLHSAVMSHLKKHIDVTLLLLGHPRLGVTVVESLTETLSAFNSSITSLPGISSVDTIINDIEKDPLEPGTVMIDANRLLLFQNKLDPRLNMIIYHVCSVGTSETNFSDPTLNNRLDLLSTYLKKYYPAEHETFLIQSKYSRKSSSVITKCKISSIHDLIKKVSFSSSLFVPAIHSTDHDPEFLKLLQSSH